MGKEQSQVGAVTNEQTDPEAIRREIEETREDLGDTAAALAAKTDVKARAKEKVDSVKQTMSEKKESIASSTSGDSDGEGAGAHASAAFVQAKSKAQENPIPVAAIGAFVVGFLLGRITASH
ncbi:MAG TPA: DUF3618 domain-containing protein [Thermoleophilaceae bacterium]|nr:DUF3618 domain-containing protein [Thermoleophilaceae bacterium]